jgi:DNA (cytosine-5)-methyltransferase 1
VNAALTLGSMCTGYGGLDLAAEAVFGTRTVWVADNDPGASLILAHHHPDVPNLGDLTAVDWATVPRVDVVTAGFPCQDLSYAGRGAGIKEGTRSGLWFTIADAVRALRPRLLVLENVRAVIARRPGLDIVLASLADLGFDAEWTCLRASDVGAPHRRERWFLLAWPADPDHQRGHGDRSRLPGRDEPPPHDFPAPDPEGDGRHQGRPQPAGIVGGPDAALSGAPTGQPASEPVVEWGAYRPSGGGNASSTGPRQRQLTLWDG